MSFTTYTVEADLIAEWTLRREAPLFEDFPGSVPPFGVEVSLPPTTPLKSRAAFMPPFLLNEVCPVRGPHGH